MKINTFLNWIWLIRETLIPDHYSRFYIRTNQKYTLKKLLKIPRKCSFYNFRNKWPHSIAVHFGTSYFNALRANVTFIFVHLTESDVRTPVNIPYQYTFNLHLGLISLRKKAWFLWQGSSENINEIFIHVSWSWHSTVFKNCCNFMCSIHVNQIILEQSPFKWSLTLTNTYEPAFKERRKLWHEPKNKTQKCMGDPTQTTLQQSSEIIDWMVAGQGFCDHPFNFGSQPQAPEPRSRRNRDRASGASLLIQVSTVP